ncbi:MAG: glycosyltransferase [Clostridia bacterium]|nr:glycosyltransferase [Clostridia bacterium]
MESKKNPKVSIIIPVYNSGKYIAKCLDSVLEQTYKDFEIIIINDGSTDNSKEIIIQYEMKYSNILKYIEQKNIGVAKTRNYGITIASGKYIMFIDNDDFINKDYIETFVRLIEKDNLDVVIGGYKRSNENGKILKSLKLKNTEWSKLMILAPWAKIYKKEYLIEKDISFLDNNIGEDVYFNLQALMLSNKILITDYIGYNWFFNTKSVSNTKQKNLKNLNVLYLLNNCYEILDEKDILNKKYELIEMYFFRYVVWYLLFTTKGLSYEAISKEYDKLILFLQEKFPNYKKNKLIKIYLPKGEILSSRITVAVFMFCHKIHLGKILVYLFSKI